MLSSVDTNRVVKVYTLFSESAKAKDNFTKLEVSHFIYKLSNSVLQKEQFLSIAKGLHGVCHRWIGNYAVVFPEEEQKGALNFTLNVKINLILA